MTSMIYNWKRSQTGDILRGDVHLTNLGKIPADNEQLKSDKNDSSPLRPLAASL